MARVEGSGLPEIDTDTMTIVDKRTTTGGKVDAPPVEINGSLYGFIPAGDYVLIRRLKVVQQGLIATPDSYTELAERGVVIATSVKAHEVPQGAITKFSKYGAEEIHFDDEGDEKYVLVRLADIRGWHNA